MFHEYGTDGGRICGFGQSTQDGLEFLPGRSAMYVQSPHYQPRLCLSGIVRDAVSCLPDLVMSLFSCVTQLRIVAPGTAASSGSESSKLRQVA